VLPRWLDWIWIKASTKEEEFLQQAVVHMSHLSYRVLAIIGSTSKIVQRIEYQILDSLLLLHFL
jgi:hypothetical protein